ncbi:hypothetical protein MESS4_510046 [Mesorhizobium sp. STM 4661]|nr:hypothetical protein MESS4_510046 [Mesorhizobium sp. STM 4661]
MGFSPGELAFRQVRFRGIRDWMVGVERFELPTLWSQIRLPIWTKLLFSIRFSQFRRCV